MLYRFVHHGFSMKTLRFLACLGAAGALWGQPSRIPRIVDATRTVLLRGNVPAPDLMGQDQGPVDPAFELSYVTLLLKPTAAQQQELEHLLAEQQDPASPRYRRWLTPAEYADRFGVSAADIGKITAWLQGQGLRVHDVARGRHWISFSGTAAQVGRALYTEFHRYRQGGAVRFGNATAPSIPADLADVVSGFAGLDDLPLRAHSTRNRNFQGSGEPRSNLGANHYLAPDDIATIYNLNPLYSAGIDGTGQKIAVVGRTAIDLADIRIFRKRFNLPDRDPQVVLVGPDPGTNLNDLGEADLDVEWSGAVARKATIVYVYARSVSTSMQYAVDNNLAPVISTSYGLCEAAGGLLFLRPWLQQANAQGITILAASGDTGAADCDAKLAVQASKGRRVDLPAAFPEVTAVGGTQFNEAGGAYWSAVNNANSGSAMSYIPETAWNNTAGRNGLLSGGGGVSMYFPKPAWQAGPGVPDLNARHVPDVALAASSDHDGYFVVTQNTTAVFGGTSVSAPVFAGIVSLANQAVAVANPNLPPGLGNVNPVLYRMAGSAPNAFHDIVEGDNIVPCMQSSADCVDGSTGFSASLGYDPVTGLGSVDAYNLVTQWDTHAESSTTVSLAMDRASLALNGSAQLTATVKPAAGAGTPTGTVRFTAADTEIGSASVEGSGVARFTLYGGALTAGDHTIYATYSGDAAFSSSWTSLKVTATLPTGNSAVIVSVTPNPAFQRQPAGNWTFTLKLSELAGADTRLTGFTIDGASYTPQIESIFGAAAIAAKGTLSGSMTLADLDIPGPVTFSFQGADTDGRTWTQQAAVPVYGPAAGSLVTFSMFPATVFQNPDSGASCQWQQLIGVYETNGFALQLTKLLAGSKDLSSQISSIFGTTRVAPLGGLQGTLCWSDITPPQSSNLELDASDENGSGLRVTLSPTLSAPSNALSKLAATPAQVMLAADDASQSPEADVSVDAGAAWTSVVFPANRTTSWLSVAPASGTGAGTIHLKTSGTGLSKGVYRAMLVVRAASGSPAYVRIPVVFVVGASATVMIDHVANAASGRNAFAPGMMLSIVGSGLASGSFSSPNRFPLPITLGGVSVTVNGVAAPIFDAAEGRITVQVPYEASAGPAVLGVNNNGQLAAAVFEVAPSAPGIFADADGKLLPAATGKQGQTMTLNITGEGDVTPVLATGEAPSSSTPASRLPQPRLPVTMTVGGVPAVIQSVVVPTGRAGQARITFTVPENAPAGVQPVVVTVGGVDSPPVNMTVTQ
jgi:uncharacterized protein (TIGR03437 family)